MQIHHVNIRTRNLDTAIAFYCGALGLRHGHRPDFGFPGAWLYDKDKPAVHLNLALDDQQPAHGGAFDHVAFEVADFDATLARLEAAGVHCYGLRHLPGLPLRQCFMQDPDGITVEITGR